MNEGKIKLTIPQWNIVNRLRAGDVLECAWSPGWSGRYQFKMIDTVSRSTVIALEKKGVVEIVAKKSQHSFGGMKVVKLTEAFK